MPVTTITNVGDVGIITDIPPYALPPNAWSYGNNVRFKENGVHKIDGYAEVMATCPIVPYFLDSYTDINGNKFFVAFGFNAIAVYSKPDTTWYNITTQTVLQLNGAVTAGDGTITVDTGAALTALDPASSGKLAIGNEETGSSNVYEVVTYSSFDTGTGVITLSGTLAYDHPDNALVTPIEGTTTTAVSYNADTTDNKWSTTNLNGILIATNGADAPQKWHLTAATSVPWTSGTSDPNNFTALTNWPDVTDRCKSIRAFKTFLIGMNWTRDGVNEPRLVKWSTGTAAANEPVTWDETDATLDAGEYPLTDTEGDIVDGLQLGEAFLIYKTDSIYVMNYVGTPYIFSFKLLSNDAGLLTKNAVCAFEGGHFFIGNSDCYVTDGQNVTAILPNKVREELFNNINGTFYKQSYVVADYVRNEIMACYPTGVAELPDRALIWNYKKNTFSFRDIPDATSISTGKFDITTGETWASVDTEGDLWEDGTEVWTRRAYDANKENLLFVDPTNTKIYRDALGNKKDTADMSVYVQRESLDLGDPSTVKYVSAVYPMMDAEGTGTVRFYVGSQMSTDEGVSWEGPFTFDPATQSKISCRVSGKYISIKVESDTDMAWKLNGIGLDFVVRGNRGSRMR